VQKTLKIRFLKGLKNKVLNEIVCLKTHILEEIKKFNQHQSS